MNYKPKIIGVLAGAIIVTLVTVVLKSLVNDLYVLPATKVDKEKMRRQTAKGWATVQAAEIVPSATVIKKTI